MDPVTGLFALLVTVFSNFPLVRRWLKDEDVLTTITVSFVLGLSVILLPLYFVGILLGQGVVTTSWIVFLTSGAILGASTVKFAPKLPEYMRRARDVLREVCRSTLGLSFVAAVAFLIVKYAYILSIKGIFDWDALQLYLPFGRRIYETDSVPLLSYDYQPVISPVGISVLYGWIYSLSGSAYAESFRYFPILFVVMTAAIIYNLGSNLASSGMAKVAVIVYSLLPLHDAVLYYASYYPDMCYNTLVLAVFFFLYKYSKKRKTIYCLLGGISLGLCMLMKTQTAYLFFATAFMLAGFSENRRLRVIAVYLISLLGGFIFVLFAWPDKSFFSGLSVVSQILAALFAFGLTSLAVIVTESQKNVPQAKGYSMSQSIGAAAVFYGTAVLVAGIWFIRNFTLTGSLLWSTGIGTENYQWALDFISASSQPPILFLDIWTYFASFILVPFTTYILGTWIVIVLVGMIAEAGAHKTSLAMITWMIGYWIGYFWSTFHHFELWYTTINPRDMYIFAPYFCLFVAFGIDYISRHLTGVHRGMLTTYLLISMGLLSLTQSLFLYVYSPIELRLALDYLARMLGSSSLALAWQASRNEMLALVPSIICYVLLATALVFVIVLLCRAIARRMSRSFPIGAKRRSLHLDDRARKAILVVAVSSLLIVPCAWSTYSFSNGDIQSFSRHQLDPLFNGLFSNVAPYINEHSEDGDMILIGQFYPLQYLQYYLHKSVRVVALDIPGNLAALKGLVEANDSSTVLSSLSDLGVRYFILDGQESQFIQYLSNKSLLLSVVRDPRYFRLITLPNWHLYESIFGREQSLIGWRDDSFSSNWTYLEEFSTENASWSFASSGGILNVGIAANAKALFEYRGVPPINTTQYPYVACRVKGSSNVRWSFRLYIQGSGTCYDFPYWWRPSANWETYVFNIAGTPLTDHLLGAAAYLSIQSVDASPATLYVDFYMVFGYESI